MKSLVTPIVALLAMAVCAAPAEAQYIPDIVELDGQTTLEFPADERMILVGGSTIEFWVQPDWTEDPGYDPVVVSNTGAQGPSWLVAMLRDRDGIGVMVGEESDIAPFDFTDGEMHHVAVVDYGEIVQVLVDNVAVADLDLTFRDLPSSGFWIGSADGANGAFKGAIAGLRIWDIAVSPDDISRFAMVDIFDEATAVHPDLEWLVGVSDFANNDFVLQEYQD